jgi:glycosyltransferase involved in cell wall biosynthesis
VRKTPSPLRRGTLPGPRLLVLSPFPPRRDARHGGARAIAHLLHRLSERNQIALLYLRAPNEPPVDELLATRLVRAEEIGYASRGTSRLHRIGGIVGDYAGLLGGTPSWVRGLRSPAFARRVRTVGAAWRPDVIQAEYPVMGQYLDALRELGGRHVLVEHDVAVAAARELRQRRHGSARLRAEGELFAWKRFESSLLRRLDAVVVFNDRDAAAVRELDAHVRLAIVPLASNVPDRPLDPVGESPPRLLFVGSFMHEPNVDAAVRLARDVFPRLRDAFPDLVLELVGHAVPAEVRALAGPRVAVHGDVPDVTPYLGRAAVVVAPIRLGGGTRVKVLEALAAGKAVVVTQRAVEGIAATPGEHLLLGETDDELAAAVAELVRDPARRAELGVAAYSWARENVSWERSAALLERLYSSLTEEHSARTT